MSDDIGHVDHLVRMLACDYPRQPSATVVAELVSQDPALVAESLVRQRVLGICLPRLQAAQPCFIDAVKGQPITKWRLPLLDAIAGSYDEAIARLDALSRHLQIPIWLIKGSVTRTLYPDSSHRDIGDVDTMVASIQQAAVLAGHLLKEGYFFEPNALPWYRLVNEGQLIGAINLRSRADRPRPNIDIHFGGYAARLCSHLSLPETHRGNGLDLCDAGTNIGYLVANAALDHAIYGKDTNDVQRYLADETVDWDRVVGRLRQAGIAGFLGLILGEIEALAALDHVQSDRLRRLRMQCGVERLTPVTGLDWRGHTFARFVSLVSDAYKAGLQTSPLHGLAVGARVGWFMWSSTRTRIAAVPSIARPRVPNSSRWAVVWLVPAAFAAQLLGRSDIVSAEDVRGRSDVRLRALPRSNGALTVASLPQGDLLLAGTQIFVPSTRRALSEKLVRELCPF